MNKQKIKSFIHDINIVDHMLCLIIIIIYLIFNKLYNRIFCNSATKEGMVNILLIYDSRRLLGNNIDAAYDYLRELNKLLNTEKYIQAGILLIPNDKKVNWRLMNLFKIANEIINFKADIYHIHYTIGAYKPGMSIYFLPLAIKYLSKTSKVLVTFHQFTDYKPNSLLFRSLLLIMCLTVDGYILFRKDHARYFLWGHTLFNKYYMIIPVPSNIPERIVNTSKKFAIEKISYFGQVREGKGLDILLESLKMLVEDAPKLTLIIVGFIDIKYVRKISKKIELNKLHNNIVFTGSLSASEIYINLANSLLVLPFPDGATTYRGSLMTGMAMGIPILTTKGEETPKYFVNKKNMFLLDLIKLNPLNLSKTIKYILNYDSNILQEIGKKGNSIYNENFSWRRCLGRHLAIYKRIR